MSPSPDRFVLIPSYNTGPRLLSTVRDALAVWAPVWVVVDGSDDRSEAPVVALASRLGPERLRVLRLARNSGKGAAVLKGLARARDEGFTHALVLDADGQHPADLIPSFMDASAANPDALILGRPIFGPDAPWERLHGRKLAIALAHLECLGRHVADPLFGFRVYPVEETLDILCAIRGARRYDFDPEIAVRLIWRGVPALNLPAPCRYLAAAEGGVSHYRYLRDNLRMAWLHLRLLSRLALSFPAVFAVSRRLRSARAFTPCSLEPHELPLSASSPSRLS